MTPRDRRHAKKNGPTKSGRKTRTPTPAPAQTRRGVSKTAASEKKLYPPYREWHRPLGWVLVVLGITIAVANDLALVDINVMPGGHSELYLILGVLVGGGGAYFLGAFSPS